MFRSLGWCSWDAFYREITEEKVRQKARELVEKKIPVRWMLMDDGWLSTKGELLCDFAPEPAKFPNGFGKMIPVSNRRRENHAQSSDGGRILPGLV